MKADAFSRQQYFPMLLANGNDAVLVDYSGSMISSLANHAHHEQQQGCPCGWYKVSHCKDKPPYKQIQPIVQSGYFVIVNGEICDIDRYEQQFDPARATLHTNVRLRDVSLEIESFLTEHGVLVENYHVTQAPPNTQIAFAVDTPVSWMSAVTLRETCTMKLKDQLDGSLSFSYSLDGVNGAGLLFSSKKPHGIASYPYTARGMYFNRVKPGWSAAKYLILTDPTDGPRYKARLKEITQQYTSAKYPAIKKAHQQKWQHTFTSSRVNLPDAKMQYLYDLSRYVVHSHQHPQSGGITVGMLPHLWSGGTYVPYDAHFAHQALLQTNALEQARHYIDYYLSQQKMGRSLARENKLPGAVYSGWTNCFGQHRARDFKEYVFHYKPMMSGVIALEFYWQWLLDPQAPQCRDYFNAMKEVLDLALNSFIDERDDHAVVRPCRAGDESMADVENDTFTAILFSRALAGLVEMAQALGIPIAPVYDRLNTKLYAGWQQNYQDGILLTYPNAKYKASMQGSYYLFNLPHGTRPSSIHGYLKHARTPWGLDSSVPTESYRDWPWFALRCSIALAHMGLSTKSFYWLKHAAKYTSALGAIPEKIRLDGFAIGYWYSSPHALFVWATVAALCHDAPDQRLRLFFGLDGKWQDVSFQNLRMAQGLLVSASLMNGRLDEIQFTNTSPQPIHRQIEFNPKYAGINNQAITIPAGQTIRLSGEKCQ